MVNVCYASPSRAASPNDYACSGVVTSVVQIPQTKYIATLTIATKTVPSYSYIIADTLTNTIISELSLSQVNFTKILNDSGQFSGVLSLDSSFKGDPYDLTTPDRRCLYVLRDGTPVWGGIIWTREYDSSNQQVRLGAGDWFSYFDHRYVFPATFAAAIVNPAYTAQQIVSFSNTDQNAVARALITNAQAQNGGNVGITLDSSLSGINIQRTYQGYDLRSVGAALRELAGVINGPDMRFDVSMDGSGNLIKNFYLGTPYLGQQGSPHLWEFGGNLQSYRWPSDGSSMATRSFALGNGSGSSMPIAVTHDTTRYFLSWPMLEKEVSYSTVSDTSVLQGHANGDQTAARAPVVLPELTVQGNITPTFGTYSPGDDARIIIQDAFMVNGIDVTMRIVKISVSPSEDQGERIVITMMPFVDEVSY